MALSWLWMLPRGWHSYTLTQWSVGHVSRQPKHWAINRILLLWDWTKSCLFMYKGTHAYCFINMQNLYQAVIYGIATTDFFTVLCRLINCSQWRSNWGQSATPDSEKLAKNREKSGKIGKNSGKSGEKKAKIGTFLSLCPSWQIGLATLLIVQHQKQLFTITY